MKTFEDRLSYVKLEYKEVSHYDLAAAIICDGFTDSNSDLAKLVNGYFGVENMEDINKAIEDYY